MRGHRFFLIITKRTIYYILTLIIIITLLLSLPTKEIQKVMNINRNKPLHNKVIVLDPGHGGIDGGTYHEDILEKNINLEIGLKLKESLIQRGATVVMTREIDDSLDDHISNGSRHLEDLNARVKIVNDNEADIFISIHVNHTKNKNKIGPIVFYNEHSEENKKIAEKMQGFLNKLSAYKEMDIKVKHDATPGDYFILRNTSSPGVIIETGFISNEIDRKLLLEKEHQDEIVELIGRCIISYFNEYD